MCLAISGLSEKEPKNEAKLSRFLDPRSHPGVSDQGKLREQRVATVGAVPTVGFFLQEPTVNPNSGLTVATGSI